MFEFSGYSTESQDLFENSLVRVEIAQKRNSRDKITATSEGQVIRADRIPRLQTALGQFRALSLSDHRIWQVAATAKTSKVLAVGVDFEALARPLSDRLKHRLASWRPSQLHGPFLAQQFPEYCHHFSWCWHEALFKAQVELEPELVFSPIEWPASNGTAIQASQSNQQHLLIKTEVWAVALSLRIEPPASAN